MRIKITVLAVLWVTLTSSALFAIPPERWYIRIVLFFVGIGVTIHVLKIKTLIK